MNHAGEQVETDGNEAFLVLNDVGVSAYGKKILDKISMEIKPGTHWAIIGPSGSGKTSLLQLLAGQLHFNAGTAAGKAGNDFGTKKWWKISTLVDTKHGFKTNDGVTGFYYQQRFNAGDITDTITVGEYLGKLMYTHDVDENEINHLNEYLQTDRLKEKLLIQLSSGETRRLLIAGALLKHPKLLLLDMPITGLDTEGKAVFDKLLLELTEKGCTVIITTTASAVPLHIGAVAVMKNGSFEKVFNRNEFEKFRITIKEQFVPDATQLHHLLASGRKSCFNQIAYMRDVVIRYGDAVIFNGLHWKVKQGEKWALVGENGAGKSTLLSLINGDHPQAYANHIILFDRKRGTGESIWDIKKNTGFVSAELYQYFPSDQTCLQIIESGFYDTIGLFRMEQAAHSPKIKAWMELLQIYGYARQLFRQAPAGVQRMVLLIRALIKNPPLLLLDEPAQGLDDEQQLQLKSIITEISSNPDITLIYVTHQWSELPDGIQKVIRLARGVPEEIMGFEEFREKV
ncbi:ATP-binding cassette domain-containing protein [Pollutibacter soli]|uniref:ATP-binding cassette domain-containing protein n=1 Tax=Pollutibacter soli TaxID=3034157 RepID=UPI0030134894